MTTQTISPISIFSDLLDGYDASRIAADISHSDFNIGLVMANSALDSFHKDNPTSQDQKNVHTVLNLIFDGTCPTELVSDYSVDNYDLACDYMKVIQSDYIVD